MTEKIRVRYAPSPTGDPHVGNIRTALFNWLFARHSGGKFIVRIEDTDIARTVASSKNTILEALQWLGLDWDEGPDIGGPYGPYVQSERVERYKLAAEELVDKDMAYYCICSAERLQEMRKSQTERKQPPGYDRLCRDAAHKPTPNKSYVTRFKMPLEGTTTFSDLIRGEITFDNKNIDDFVVLKSDGYPTYHLANVVDDHAMDISHVMRSDEWVSSTPKHVQLYQALGNKVPAFAHLPMILGPDKAKLSKRHGSVSILQYKEEGFLPEAMINFLALLGWSIDDHTEIVSMKDLVDWFSIERIGKAGAVFNHDKLNWMNGVYIRNMSIDDLIEKASDVLAESINTELNQTTYKDYLSKIMPLVQERIKTLNELPDLIQFFFKTQVSFSTEELIQKGMDSDKTILSLQAAISKLSVLMNWNATNIEQALRLEADNLGIKAGQLFGTLRISLTGQRLAPPLFDTMAVLGKVTCLNRLNEALQTINHVD